MYTNNSSALIAELQADIEEFGGHTVVAVWCKEAEGVILYVNYDFIEEENPIAKAELQDGEFLKTMTMTALLEILKIQNEVL